MGELDSVARSDLAILGPGSVSARMHLQDAVRNNHVLLVRQLLEIGVDPNAEYDSMPGPLFCARSVEMVSVLVAAGAAVCARKANGCTPLHYAALRCGKEPGPESYGVIAALISAGADVNSRDMTGATALEFPQLDDPGPIALAGQQAPSVRPATRSEFWRRRCSISSAQGRSCRTWNGRS